MSCRRGQASPVGPMPEVAEAKDWGGGGEHRGHNSKPDTCYTFIILLLAALSMDVKALEKGDKHLITKS